MKKWKKYAGLLLALVLCLNLTACGDSNGTDVETDIETNAGGTDIETDVETNAGGTDVEIDGDAVPALMCDSISFTNMENLQFENYEDGTYYYEDMAEDGLVILINTVMPHDFLNDTRSLEEYLTDCALGLCESEPCLLAAEENDVYSAQMTFPVYIVTYTSGENEDTREWTVFAMNTDRYTYLYGFCSSCNAEDDVKSAYQDIFAGLYLSDRE